MNEAELEQRGEALREDGKVLIGRERFKNELPPPAAIPMLVESKGRVNAELVPREQAETITQLHARGYTRIVFGKSRRERRAEAARARRG